MSQYRHSQAGLAILCIYAAVPRRRLIKHLTRRAAEARSSGAWRVGRVEMACRGLRYSVPVGDVALAWISWSQESSYRGAVRGVRGGPAGSSGPVRGESRAASPGGLGASVRERMMGGGMRSMSVDDAGLASMCCACRGGGTPGSGATCETGTEYGPYSCLALYAAAWPWEGWSGQGKSRRGRQKGTNQSVSLCRAAWATGGAATVRAPRGLAAARAGACVRLDAVARRADGTAMVGIFTWEGAEEME